MTIGNLELSLHAGGGVPERLVDPLFALELPLFGDKYMKCPRTPASSRQRYGGNEVTAVFAEHKQELVGARLFRRLSHDVAESMVMMVRSDWQGRGIASLMCAAIVPVLRWQGFHYCTSWTHVSLTAAEILHRCAPLVSREVNLSDLEVALLRLSEADDGKPPGTYGSKRVVPAFFQMRDGSSGDARFWVHAIR